MEPPTTDVSSTANTPSNPGTMQTTESTAETAAPLDLRADFSITVQSESTTKLNKTFELLMVTVLATPGLAFRGPLRLPKDDKIHSRRIDLKSIPEKQLREIAAKSGILLSQDAGAERIQTNGVVVAFDIE